MGDADQRHGVSYYVCLAENATADSRANITMRWPDSQIVSFATMRLLLANQFSTSLISHATPLQRTLEREHHRRPCRAVHLDKVLPPIPRKRCRKEARALINISMPAKVLAIGAQHNAVGALLLDANAVVGEAALRVEVEDPQQARALKHNDLVALVLEADVRLRRMQPAVLLLCPLHLGVEVVEESVAQELVVDEVELAARVVERVSVAFAGEVEPLRVPELVAFEIEVALAAEAVRDEADHLVQREAAGDDGGFFGEGRHVRVHFGVAEPEEEGFVTD